MQNIHRFLSLVFIIGFQCCLVALSQQVIVETDEAIYRGRVLSLNSQVPQQQTISFLGVPYAQPPLNELRFAAPLPWRPAIPEGNSSGKPELNATKAGPACLQRPDQSGTPIRMSEDCLYLNVHSPPAPGAHRSVLVWLHGGFLETGAISNPDQTGNVFGWDLMVSYQSLLLVEIAYRLGVFGFLTEQEAGNGNAGLKDQQLALAWIAANIGHFGGHNGSVTLAGLDGGAAAVGWHMLSPGSNDLFQRAFFLGGGPLAGWGFVRNREALRTVHDTFYSLAGCTNRSELLNCLRSISADELNAYQAKFNRGFDRVEFPAVVDGEFLQSDPIEAFELGNFEHKSTVLGVTSLEGIQLSYRALRAFNVTNQSNLTGQVHLDLLAEAFRYLPRFPEELSPLANEFLQLKLTAYPGDDLGIRNFALLTGALSERVVVCDSNRLADLLLQAADGRQDIFVYQLDEPDGNTDEYRGAGHGKDAAYFVGEPLRRADYDLQQRDLSRIMMNLLELFLTTGNLTQTVWKPSSRVGLDFYRLRVPRSADWRSQMVKGGYDRQSCRLWSELLPLMGVVTPTTSAKPDEDAEAKFWARCNATINLVSIIAIGIGGGLVLLLIVCVVLVARGRHGSSHDFVELHQRIKPSGK